MPWCCLCLFYLWFWSCSIFVPYPAAAWAPSFAIQPVFSSTRFAEVIFSSFNYMYIFFQSSKSFHSDQFEWFMSVNSHGHINSYSINSRLISVKKLDLNQHLITLIILISITILVVFFHNFHTHTKHFFFLFTFSLIICNWEFYYEPGNRFSITYAINET